MGEGDTVVRTLGAHEKLDLMAGDAFSGAFKGGRRRAADRPYKARHVPLSHARSAEADPSSARRSIASRAHVYPSQSHA